MLNAIKNKINITMISGEEARKNCVDYHLKASSIPKMFVDVWSKEIAKASKQGKTSIETDCIKVDDNDKVIWFSQGYGKRIRVDFYGVTLKMLTSPFDSNGFDVKVVNLDGNLNHKNGLCYLKISWID